MNQPTQRIQPVSPMPYAPPPVPKPRSAFMTGFAVAMGVMTAVTIWAIGWGIAGGLLLSIFAAIGSAG